MNGWHGSATWYLKKRVGLTADLGGNYAEGFRQHSFLFGPQFRTLNRKYFSLSTRVLVGASNTNRASNSQGFTFHPSTALDIRLGEQWKWRTQTGFFLTRFGGEFERNLRVSTGLVWHWGQR